MRIQRFDGHAVNFAVVDDDIVAVAVMISRDFHYACLSRGNITTPCDINTSMEFLCPIYRRCTVSEGDEMYPLAGLMKAPVIVVPVFVPVVGADVPTVFKT